MSLNHEQFFIQSHSFHQCRDNNAFCASLPALDYCGLHSVSVDEYRFEDCSYLGQGFTGRAYNETILIKQNETVNENVELRQRLDRLTEELEREKLTFQN